MTHLCKEPVPKLGDVTGLTDAYTSPTQLVDLTNTPGTEWQHIKCVCPAIVKEAQVLPNRDNKSTVKSFYKKNGEQDYSGGLQN